NWTEGCEEFSDLSPEQVQTLLGISHGRVPFFNDFVDPTDNLTSADGDAWVKFVADAEGGRKALDPYWHQFVRMLAMVDKAFKGQPILLMDEVGLGKTLTVIGFLCLMTYYREYFQKHRCFPNNSLIAGKRFPSTQDGNIPCLDSHWSLPPTLLEQFQSELARFTRYGTFDLIPCVGRHASRKSFVTEAKKRTSAGRLEDREGRRIWVSTHSAIAEDARTFLSYDFSEPDELVTRPGEGKLDETLFGMTFLLNIMDKAHKVQNNNQNTVALRALAEKSAVTVAMTATPINREPKDLRNIGRSIGIKTFGTVAANAATDKKIQAARKKSKKAAGKGQGYDMKILRGAKPEATPATAELDALLTTEIDSLRAIYRPHVIRRTAHSRTWNNEPLLDLTPYRETVLLCTLYDDEIINLEAVATDMNESGDVIQTVIHGKDFYLQFRQCVAHPGCENVQKWSNPKTLAEWRENPSRKIDVLAEVILYHLARDNRYPLQPFDGDMQEYNYDIKSNSLLPRQTLSNIVDDVNPENPEKACKVYDESVPTSETAPDKVVVYCAFPSSYSKIIQALGCLGIPATQIAQLDGKMPVKRRSEIIMQFNTAKGPRVLLLSNVGVTGLNLQVARIMIIFDSPWSSQDLDQLRGRVWRHGQTKQVDVYHIVAQGTPDVFLNNLSVSKAALHDMFVGEATS
ncbi:P-loop containing nucleoside triphosphate hydrolase protein, partial [Mycena floridula]